MPKKKATEAPCDEDNGQDKDVSSTKENDPWNPPYPPLAPGPCKDLNSHIKLINEWMDQKEAVIAASRATNTIIPDLLRFFAVCVTLTNVAFFNKLSRLMPILEKDSVKLFLNFFKHDKGGLAWGFVITPQTFNQMIVQNALRCAKVALDGKAPELNGHRANPNYMNPSGYFPLHQAAEMFSADMIKLLFHYGASANLRMAGPEVFENLLPLHVAVENACRHKFLEDNLLPDKENRDYVYRLIQLLCLPEMKIFLDTVRLIAERTDDLLDEVWKYIKDGKLAETAVLLLAAQKKIRTGSSFKANGNCATDGDGFFIISNLCSKDILALNSEIVQKRARKKQLKAEKKLRCMTYFGCVHPWCLFRHYVVAEAGCNWYHLGINIFPLSKKINEAGEALDSYIRAHPEVPSAMQVSHVEVLERVSSIFKNHGLFPTGECINTGNLCPYEQQLSTSSDEELPEKCDAYATAGKAARKKQPRGWELEYTRRSFLPHWTVLSQLHERQSTMIKLQTIQEIEENWHKRSSTIPNNKRLLGRIPQLTRNRQARRLFGTATSTVLKLLKHA